MFYKLSLTEYPEKQFFVELHNSLGRSILLEQDFKPKLASFLFTINLYS